MASEYTYLVISGVIKFKSDTGQTIHRDHARKMVKDLTSILDVYGMRLAGRVSGRSLVVKGTGGPPVTLVDSDDIYPLENPALVDDSTAEEPAGLRCMRCGGESPQCACTDEHPDVAALAAGAQGGSPPPAHKWWLRAEEWYMHNHRHEHTDYLAEGVVKVEHDHWHVHPIAEATSHSTVKTVYHSGLHLDFGNGEEPGNPVRHYDKLPQEFSRLSPENWGTAIKHDIPAPGTTGNACDPLIGLADGDDDDEEGCCGAAGRDPTCCSDVALVDKPATNDGVDEQAGLLTRHVETCAACQNCEACRRGDAHTHLHPVDNKPAHTHEPLNEYEAINKTRS